MYALPRIGPHENGGTGMTGLEIDGISKRYGDVVADGTGLGGRFLIRLPSA